MQFYPHASIEIPRNSDGLVAGDKESLSGFWEEVDTLESGLTYGVGCYIFSIRAGRGCLPWYVGKAEKQSFAEECFTPHKINHYNNCISNRKGTPLLKLIAKYTPQGRLSQPSINGHRDISYLERMIISLCIQRNPDLANVKDTKMLREMVVPGLVNNSPGRDRSDVQEFKDLLGVSQK